MNKLAQLEALAQKATPGIRTAKRLPRASNFERDRRYTINTPDFKRVAYVFGQFDPQHDADAELIAACSPEFILTLITVVRAADAMRNDSECVEDDWSLGRRYDDARAQLEQSP